MIHIFCQWEEFSDTFLYIRSSVATFIYFRRLKISICKCVCVCDITSVKTRKMDLSVSKYDLLLTAFHYVMIMNYIFKLYLIYIYFFVLKANLIYSLTVIKVMISRKCSVLLKSHNIARCVLLHLTHSVLLLFQACSNGCDFSDVRTIRFGAHFYAVWRARVCNQARYSNRTQ